MSEKLYGYVVVLLLGYVLAATIFGRRGGGTGIVVVPTEEVSNQADMIGCGLGILMMLGALVILMLVLDI